MNRLIAARNRCAIQYKYWRRQTEGSVSVFLIMVLAFVFLFSAVLIDYARMAAASVQGERLARAAVRSVMSAYDVELREQYGLFAFGGSDGDELMARTLDDTFHKSGRGDSFNLVNLGLDTSTLEWSRSLGSYDVFRRQIHEEMKYKAPVDFALEIAGKFKPLSGALEEASRTTDLFAELQPLYDKREAALDRMLEYRRQAAENARQPLTLIKNPAVGGIADASMGTVSSAADIAAQYNDYVRKYYADLNRDPKRMSQYTWIIQSYLTQSAAIASRLGSLLAYWQDKHAPLMRQAGDAIKEAEAINEEMRETIRQAKSTKAGSGYDSSVSWDIPDSEADVAARPNLLEQAEQLLLDAEDFRGMERNLAMQEAAYRDADSGASSLAEIVNPASAGPDGDSGAMKAAVTGAAGVLDAYLRDYGNGGAVIGREASEIGEHRGSDNQRKALEREAKTKLGEALKTAEALRNLAGGAKEALERYEMLNQYYEENVDYNRGLRENSPDRPAENDPYAAESAAMNHMDDLYEALSGVMLASRDRLFQSEYAAQYFPHFDISQLTDIAGGTTEEIGEKLKDQLDPHSQELEYILYGFNRPGLNVGAAYSEIFAMRLAVRTMEGFVKKAGLGNPLLIVASAVLYGLTEAVKDMITLCREGAAPLSEYVPAKLTYRDYLRLFMMLHGSGQAELSRMLALIRLNTGINPDDSSTYASAEIRIGMRLWFLPGIMKLLRHTGAVPGEIDGQTYFSVVKADFAY
ncbi:hypothetical protein J2Z22_001560 [Paenibacillus forsythiae]|uniref:Flp pilus-assembly TadG-like N-terminal domain-containing protein n=2 Tax=Paenibacillus forsythiae TaxID=365616 RepID=A0ABU3H5E0_9BACL|nr:hypothetical protein [Paenibacillus forsythiae]MDT3426040.1 hypothetical protein [Paenibacillus forsythiae]